MKKEMPILAPHSHPMHGGNGPHSYANNSSYQKAALESILGKTREAILAKLDLQSSHFNPNIFVIADFGCSVGPNTFCAVDKIVETVKLKYSRESKTYDDGELEFHVFFNDLSNNDFNTLFRSLPLLGDRGYSVSGVPGSFYGRVFPSSSVHIGFTSLTLHWLSKTPEEVCNRDSMACNKSSIQCNGLVEAVTEAYERQLKKDMGRFLETRAEEIVSDGLMIMLVMCLPDGVKMARTWKGVVFDMMRDCLIDMAKSGVTSVEKIESFSIPFYFSHITTLKGAIEQNKSFEIEIMEEVKHPMEDMTLSNDFITSMMRAGLHGLIDGFFGDGVSDELFERLPKKLAENPIDFQACEKDTLCLIALKRKVK